MTSTLDQLKRKSLGSLVRTLSVARRFFVDLAPHKLPIVGIMALSGVSIATELLRPWPIQWIFDNALIRDSKHTQHDVSFVLWTGLFAAIAITALRSTLDYFGAILTNRVGQAVARGLRYRVFSHLAELSPGFHARQKSGDLLVRLMGDVPMVRTMLVDSSIDLATRAVMVAGTLGVMFWMDWFLTTAMLVIVPAFLLVASSLSRQMTDVARKQRKREGRLADYIQEAISATAVIQSLGRAQHIVDRFSKSNRSQARAELKAAALSARLSATVETLFGFATVVALGLGTWRVLTGHLSPGELLAFLSYVRSLLKPARSTGKHSVRISRGVACAERLLAILDAPIEIRSPPDAVPAPAHPRRLAFEDVHFGYGETEDALRGVSAEFESGKLYGVFGKSGSGKSTFAALALRLYDPDRGRVTLDGVDLRRFELSSLRDRFGLCMQDAVLFGDTIRENLLLGRPAATDAELWAACRAAAADGFVAELPTGLDTELGSSGTGLSGGERRRLVLARTFLRDAPVLIVDEPFAGLDTPSVDRVRATLAALARDHVVLVIAHDLEYLDAFDEILFVADGQVIDRGRHEDLLSRNALYRRITRANPPVSS